MGITVSGRCILASASPRRIELLRLMGLDFEVIPASIDESALPGELPQAHVLRLSEAKACAIAHRHPDAWILGADTIVVVEGKVIGKPGSVSEAKGMLEKLSDRMHQVYTGFCIIRQDRLVRIQEVVGSSVLFRKIASDEIAWYTSTEEPYDKAGAYAVQGMGAFLIREIHGSWTNVMGLPLCEVVDALKRTGVIGFKS